MNRKQWQSPLLVEDEMDQLDTEHRLEPNIAAKEGENRALLSLAISVKRAVDLFEGISAERQKERRLFKMIAALRRIGHSPYEVYRMAINYFELEKTQ